MNDLPQNELFSAYLDGELTAAEQAEMERLLATDPAARRLLDELKALSQTLQSLPQEKLGEDLSQRVLQAAERRMLTEGGPGDDELAPMPLDRSIFRSIISRRTLVWLSLTAAIAIVITINDRWQGGPVQVARNELPAAAEPKPGESEPPTIQAMPEATSSVKADQGMGFKRQSEIAPRSGQVPVASPVAPPSFAAKAKATAEKPADRDRKADVAADRMDYSAPTESKSAATMDAPSRSVSKAAPVRSKDSDVSGKMGGMAGKRGVMMRKGPSAEESQPPGAVLEGSVLVVRCNVSPEAANNRVMEKLLATNGITWLEKGNRRQELAKAAKEQGGEEAKQSLAQDAAQQVDGQDVAFGRLAGETSGTAKFVYDVEASQAQIQATLAALAAQPKAFLSFSVAPRGAPGQPGDAYQPPMLASDKAQLKSAVGGMGGGMGGQFQFNQNVRVAGPESNAGPSGELDIKVTQTAPERVNAKNAPASGEAGKKAEVQAPSKPQPQQAITSTLVQQQAQPQSLLLPSRQRVLFVLNVVGDATAPVASKAAAKLPAEAEAAKAAAEPALPATPPVNAPAKEKK
jgi:hypothetical protein